MKSPASLFSAAVVLSAAVSTASATAIHITAPVVCVLNACDGTERDYGELVIDLNATGLPATGEMTASVTDVVASLTLGDGQEFFGSGGSGQVMTDTEYADILSFAAGNFNAYMDVPVGWTGNGALPGDDGENSSFISYGNLDYYVNVGQSTTVTPEPESIALMLVGLSATGCAWAGMARRRLLRR